MLGHFFAPLQFNTTMEIALCLHNRVPVTARFLMIATLFLLALLPNGQLVGTERDIFRSDILTFHGNQRVAVDTLSIDSFPVVLTCKTTDPAQIPPIYTIILRGIDRIEKAVLLDAQHGKWNNFDLFRAAMIVEGIRDPQLINAYEARLDALVARVLATARGEGNATPQAITRALFEAMHKEILTKSYSLDCTELSKVMQTGQFNCVSATVLFNVLAEKAGLDVYALEMPGHALSRVRFPDGSNMDIETTAPTWFAMQTDHERRQATLERIAPAPAVTNPATAQNAAAPPPVIAETELTADLREISAVQLVATIYYNIGVGLHAKKHYPEAVAANIKVLYLDKENGQAWTNLIASLNNWALNLADERNGRRYDEAITILDRGVVLDPTYVGFRTNQTFVLYHWIHGLAMKGLFDDARQTYAGVKTRQLDNESFQKLMSDVDLAERNINQQRASQQRR